MVAMPLHVACFLHFTVEKVKVKSIQFAQQFGHTDEDSLLKQKKLVLLIDLDKTLVHTTKGSIPANLKDVYHLQLDGPQSPWYHTRLRPGTRHFLDTVANFYELHIFTLGARVYAHKIAHLLDPDGVLFHDRIYTRDECINVTSKTANLKFLFPCGDSLICIIDDRTDIWNFAPNVVHVKPYHFKCSGSNSVSSTDDSNVRSTPEGAKNLDFSGDTRSDPSVINILDKDDYLIYLEKILLTIHKAYYQILDKVVQPGKGNVPDLKNVIPYVRKKVLKGVNIVFSGVIPVNMPPDKNHLWIIAKSLGANVSQDLVLDTKNTNCTTHVIAAKLGTAKLNKVKNMRNIHVVTPNWLVCCSERWEHADVRDFFLLTSGRKRKNDEEHESYNENLTSGEWSRDCKKIK